MKRLIIDADTGIDDSLAILFAGLREDCTIEGISTVFGNTTASQGAANTLKMLDLIGYRDIPVAVGANAPLVGKAEFFWKVHGHNGIGDVELPESKRPLSALSGPELIVKLARENPGELILVTLGRLTNVALALQLEPELPKLVQKLVFMGGTIYQEGNTAPFAEANIYGDPLAASQVLQAGFEAVQVGLDVTQNTHLTLADLTWLSANCRPENAAAVAYLRQAMVFYFGFNHEASGMVDCCPVHDPLAMLIALEPERAQMESWPANVETQGSFTRGQLVIDKRLGHNPWPPLNCVLKVNGRSCVKTILQTFC